MAQSTALPVRKPALPGLREAWPGLLAILVIALLVGVPGITLGGFTLENALKALDNILPKLGGKGLFTGILHFNYVVAALLVGIIIRNVIGMPKAWTAGISYNAVLYKTGIVILGSQYMLSDLAKLGPVSLAIVVVFVFFTAWLVLWLGKVFRVSNAMTGTLSGGCAICGVSAAVATAPMVGAKSTEVAYTIATILSFGLIALFAMPYLGRWIGLTDYEYGVWSATGILNSAQVIASGFMFSDEAGKVAGFVNMGRVVLLPLAALFVGIIVMAREVKAGLAVPGQKINKWQVIRDKFPVFVFGFIIIWFLTSAGAFTPESRVWMGKVMTWFFTLGFVGLGLGTNLRDLKKAGGKPLIIGLIAGLAKVGLSLLVVIGAGRLGLL